MTSTNQVHTVAATLETAINALRLYQSKTIAVGLSGGVDSSTVLALLKKAGAQVIGISMKIYNPDAGTVPPGIDACYGPGEAEDFVLCASICETLGVPYHVIDCTKEYEAQILQYFRDEYMRGRTPNPCIRCNLEMKFGFMLEEARRQNISFDYFATGHYVRIEPRAGIRHLRRGVDDFKDQSYFLYRLAPATLAGLLFPLGIYTKQDVKAFARELGLPTADKPESQDFVGGNYSILFDETKPGDMVDEAGNILGKHKGIIHYTIGQRRGVGVSSTGEPYYVLTIIPEKNQVVLSTNSKLFSGGLLGSDPVVHDPALRSAPFCAMVKIRQAHKPAPATVHIENGTARVIFDEPQRAIAPGQSAVFYDEAGFVLGGCIIEKSVPLES